MIGNIPKSFVERIAQRFLTAIENWPDAAGQDEETLKGIAMVGAWECIDDIRHAIENGELQLPREAGRLTQQSSTRRYAHGVEESLKGWILNQFKTGARTFIALSSLTKTRPEIDKGEEHD